MARWRATRGGKKGLALAWLVEATLIRHSQRGVGSAWGMIRVAKW